MSSSRKLYFESLRIGEELPSVGKAPIDRVQLARYAGASGDFNPVHVDETYAKEIGLPSVYAPGMLVMGFLGQLVSDWCRGAQLRRYNVRFVKMTWPGDTIVCKGRVTDRWGTGGRYFAEVDLWAENQKGELIMKGQSEVQMFYSLEDETRQRAGESPVVVEVARERLVEQVAQPKVEPPSEERSAPKKKSAQRDKPAARNATARSAASKSTAKPPVKGASKAGGKAAAKAPTKKKASS